MPGLNFTIHATDGAARTGTVAMARGEIVLDRLVEETNLEEVSDTL